MASYPITTPMNSIDPTSLFFVQAASAAAAPSPAPSSSSSQAQSQQAPRKRPRTDYATSEERKEARAERNRVAAQISRDRRKAEFAELRDRVSQLERENSALRATSSSSSASAAASLFTATATTSSHLESEREKENRELKERVRVLESALATLSQNVVNALQGVGGGMGALSNLVSTAPATASTPTPVPANQSTPTSSSSPSTTSQLVNASDNKEVSTRHLARVACVLSPSLGDETSLQRVEPTTTPQLPTTTPSTRPTLTLRTGFVPSSTPPPVPPPTRPPRRRRLLRLQLPHSSSQRLRHRPRQPTRTSFVLLRSRPKIHH